MLSEVCLEFSQALAHSARRIAAEAHHMKMLDDHSTLSNEIEALLRASIKVATDPHDLDGVFRLLSLTNQIYKSCEQSLGFTSQFCGPTRVAWPQAGMGERE